MTMDIFKKCRVAAGLVLLAAVSAMAVPAQAQEQDTEAEFRAGMKAVAERRLDDAIATFRAILIRRPELTRVRLELARAFFLKDDYELAKEHFEYVLAGNPPKPVVANVRRFLDAIRAKRRWDAHFGFALLPDSNITTGSSGRIIYIPFFGTLLPFQLTEAQQKSGVGVHVWGGGEYQFPWTETSRLRGGADLSVKDYSGSRFDQVNLSLRAGPRVLLARSLDVSVLASGRLSWEAGARRYHETGLIWEAKRPLTDRLSVNGSMSWHKRFYRGRSNSLNGAITGFSLGGDHVLTPTLRTSFLYRHGRERPGTVRWRNQSHVAGASVTTLLPRGFTVTAGLDLNWKRYRGNWLPHVLDGSSRKDRTRIVRLSLLNQKIAVYGFSPRLVLAHEHRDSNAQLYGYDRVRAEIQVKRLF